MPEKIKEGNTVKAEFSYETGKGGSGRLLETIDNFSGVTYTNTYDTVDSEGLVCDAQTQKISNSVDCSFTEKRDAAGKARKSIYAKSGQAANEYSYAYRKNSAGKEYPADEISQVKLTKSASTVFTSDIGCDALSRPQTTTLKLGNNSSSYISKTITYSNGTGNGAIKSISATLPGAQSASEEFIYDTKGNIIQYKHQFAGRGATHFYTYDELSRLTSEITPISIKYFTYDAAGNIHRKDTGGNDLYVYDTVKKDRLVSFKGQACAYDDMGNPTTYRDKALSWTRGRMLSGYNNNAVTFEYNAAGLRTKKTANGNVTSYTLNGSRIIWEQTKNSTGSVTRTINYYYDASGAIGFNLNGTDYYYVKNIFGDVVDLYNGNTRVAAYYYSSFGECTVINDTDGIGAINPIRYRGYYFDGETGLYYLQSRYYDPEVCRFINADDVSYLDPKSINGINLYAYCVNNPVMLTDSSGYDWQIDYFGKKILTFFENIAAVYTELYKFFASEKIADVPWKRYHRSNSKVSRRQFNRNNARATAETSKIGKIFGKIGSIITIAAFGIELGISLFKNIQNDAGADKIFGDFARIGTSLALNIAVISAFSFIPIVGPIIGFVATILLQDAINTVADFFGNVVEGMVNGWNNFWSFKWLTGN